MDELDDSIKLQRSEAREVLRRLALGLHPGTGEPLPHNGILDEPNVMRALFVAVEALQSTKLSAAIKKDRPVNAGQAWSSDEDHRLKDEWTRCLPLHFIATAHERRPSAVLARLVRLKLAATRMDARRILARGEQQIP